MDYIEVLKEKDTNYIVGVYCRMGGVLVKKLIDAYEAANIEGMERDGEYTLKVATKFPRYEKGALVQRTTFDFQVIDRGPLKYFI